jgi:apolipoprotein N-acyltransferase
MPFSLAQPTGIASYIYRAVERWGVPLIAGAYAPPEGPPYADHNAAFLLEPVPGSPLRVSVYHKNILLAFGEYFPGGEYFPQVYEWAPQVSQFKHGTDQRIFTLQDGTRLGATICYEDISPSFFRKVANQKVHAIVNLTNDSWFGPTSEPYQHAALSVFRAIETRTPLIRVTNTGISFAVDRSGRMSQTTPVYKEGILVLDVPLGATPQTTLYLRFGEWFLALLTLGLVSLLVRAAYVPLPL